MSKRILVTGGGTFLGDQIAAALLAEGAEVTLLVREPDRLGPLAGRVRWSVADVWDSASMRGRARGHAAVIHTVGSMTADPAQGLTHHRLNFVSARNVTAMCVSDGVAQMILLSSVRAPWVSSQYIQSKREAEQYLGRVGVQGTIIRAPVAYIRGQRRVPFFALVSLLGWLPRVGRIAPMPVDDLARGVARITLETNRTKSIYYAADLRKRSRTGESAPPVVVPAGTALDDDAPFGWTPPTDKRS